MNYCIRECGIKHVLTSRKFMEKFDYQLDAEVVYLEDFKERVTTADKLSGVVSTFLTPASLLERSLKLHDIKSSDTLTVIFSSGSTGTPTGVMLTHGNVGSNVEAINQVVHLTKDDTIIGILPLFHSFGYTVTMWSVFMLDIKGAYHFSPLEPKQIGKLAEKHKATILLSTPTFLRSYLRRVSAEEFASLNVVVCGAEKLPQDLVDAFEEKFNVRPVEGYGCTELSPLVSVNIPPSRSINNFQNDLKEGTVGRAVPGVSAKVVDLDTGRDLGVDEPGMLLIKGPNVMQGYLHQPEKTAEVLRDGWYTTGDVATIDDEGFITITGRISRFSKIGGEMVPHIKVEELLWRIVGGGEDEAPKLAVTAVPDDRKGERLVVLHTPLEKTPDELCTALKAAGLPNLFIPGADSFIQVETLPVLGTGKFDLRAIKQLALEHFAPA
jgi:acyl-[acyl-carrier-protein]-phospholipid O-acyltransferase/long-chain-fatty-acid--[acyl-carrier-protein] ligase